VASILLTGVVLGACVSGRQTEATDRGAAPAQPYDSLVALEARAGAYVRFSAPRTLALGRSGGYTEVRSITELDGRVIDDRPDTLVVLVTQLRRSDGSRAASPLGATVRVALDSTVNVQRAAPPVDRSASRQAMLAVFLGLAAGALLVAVLSGGWSEGT
jgi:hypothetical protein